jgi:hypothetical protein
LTGIEEVMSTVRDFALPIPPIARDRNLAKAMAILAAILRLLHTRSERRRLDRAVPEKPCCHPVLPTFFPFDVRYFVGEGCAGQRNERR